MAQRQITVSTVGGPPDSPKLAGPCQTERLGRPDQFTLAVSLHAPDKRCAKAAEFPTAQCLPVLPKLL